MRKLLEDIKNLPMTFAEINAMSVGQEIDVYLCAPVTSTGFLLSYKDIVTDGYNLEATTTRGLLYGKRGFDLTQSDTSNFTFKLKKTGNGTFNLYRYQNWGYLESLPSGTYSNCIVLAEDQSDHQHKYVGANRTTMMVTPDLATVLSNTTNYRWEVRSNGTGIIVNNPSQNCYFYWAQGGSTGSFSLRSGQQTTYVLNQKDDSNDEYTISGKKGNITISNGQPTTVSQTAKAPWHIFRVNNIQPNHDTGTNEVLWDNATTNLRILNNIPSDTSSIVGFHNHDCIVQIQNALANYYLSNDGTVDTLRYSQTMDANSNWLIFRK